jgi:SET domain-containing protein
MANVSVKPSPIEGQGVFAAVDFRKGERILAIDDSRVVTEDAPLREGEDPRHCDYLAAGRVVLMQPPERHINHSCDPNAYVRTIDGVRYVLALRDIAMGEEITYDYCINSGGDTVWRCNCGSERCRRMIHSDFFHLPRALQLEYLPLLDGWFVEEHREHVERLQRAAAYE